MLEIILVILFVCFPLVTFMIIYAARLIPKHVPVCPECRKVKFRYFEWEKTIMCKKCGLPMEWVLIPEDVINSLVLYYRIPMALGYPLFLGAFLFAIDLAVDSYPLWGLWLCIILICGFAGAMIVGFVIAFLFIRKKMRNWVEKSDQFIFQRK